MNRLNWFNEAIFLWTRNSNPPVLNTTHPHRQIYIQQQKIGWDNISRGTFPISLRNEVSRIMDTPQQANKRVVQQITIIWKWVIESWRFRCEAQHGRCEGAMLTPQLRLNQRIHSCFEYENRLPWNDRRQFQKTETERQNQNTFQQETWLLIVEPLIDYHKTQINARLPGYHDI